MWRAISISCRRGPAAILRRRQQVPLPMAVVPCRGFAESGSDDGKRDKGLSDVYEELFGASDNAGKESLLRQEQASRPIGVSPAARAQPEQEEIQTTSTAAGSGVPEPLWTDSWEISDERHQTKLDFDDIPIWSPDFVSRISKERVKIHPEGIPTLSELAQLALPPPPMPHPGHGETIEYAAQRKRAHFEYVRERALSIAESKVNAILKLQTWKEKQDAVDVLFEQVEFQLRDQEKILSSHPLFGTWVEKSLEGYLRTFNKTHTAAIADTAISSSEGGDVETGDSADAVSTSDHEAETTTPSYPTMEEDAKAAPLFMDCFNKDDSEDVMVPKILSPLKPHPHDGPGRMVEEWDLSAHATSKRILLRQSTRQIARSLEESVSSRVYVTGRRGVGKSAALAAIVASARKSGYIVLYMPDGNRLHRHGYYIRPNAKDDELYDLPVLSQEVCKELRVAHKEDISGMEADEATLKHFLTDLQLEEFPDYTGGGFGLVDLLKLAEQKTSLAAMCYSVTIDCLMKQDDKPFLMVLDEFNSYYERGHYYHMHYDDSVRRSIPYNKINLFKPALDAMALAAPPPLEHDEDQPLLAPVPIKRGGIVVGISESCAVARRVTDALNTYAALSATKGSSDIPLRVCDVPRFTELEVDHVLANYESIGIGNLRCDRGETIMNKQGIAYLRTVSGGVGQNLLDVCCY